MTWLMEQPTLIVIIGALTVAILGGGWLKTGHRALVIALVAAAVLFGVLLFVERTVKTEREQLRETLGRIAADVQSNDVDAVVRHIHPDSPDIRSRAKAEMPNYDFEKISITRVRTIDVSYQDDPLTATVEFNVVAKGNSKGFYGEFNVPRYVILSFSKDSDGRWRITDYEHFPPQEGIRERDDS